MHVAFGSWQHSFKVHNKVSPVLIIVPLIFRRKSSPSSVCRKRMEAYRGQGGIQQLLAVEQEAQQIVNAARSAKMARLKQAKDEAEKESAEYRANLELQFQSNVSESSGNSGANVKRLEQDTEAKIHQLKEEAGRISSDVADMLLRQVTIVKN